MKEITHDLNHDLTHSIRSMFRVLGIYNFDARAKSRIFFSLFFFGKLKTPKSPTENFQPLVRYIGSGVVNLPLSVITHATRQKLLLVCCITHN